MLRDMVRSSGVRGPARSWTQAWVASNLAANLNNSNSFGFIGGTSLRWFVATRRTVFTMISLMLNTPDAAPAGSVTVSIVKNGVVLGGEYVLSLSPSGANPEPASKAFVAPLVIAADDNIALVISTSANWNNTLADVSASLEMES